MHLHSGNWQEGGTTCTIPVNYTGEEETILAHWLIVYVKPDGYYGAKEFVVENVRQSILYFQEVEGAQAVNQIVSITRLETEDN